jgi:serine/threonine-protein kinase
VYALGVMLYEMLAGRVPFSRRTPLATMAAQLTEPLEPPRSVARDKDIPPALEAVVCRALEKERDRRVAPAGSLREALASALEQRVVSVRPGASEGAPSEDMELGETDLAIRLSQVVPERRAGLDGRGPRSSPTSAPPSAASTSAPPVVASETSGFTVAAIVVALLAIGAGILLALR